MNCQVVAKVHIFHIASTFPRVSYGRGKEAEARKASPSVAGSGRPPQLGELNGGSAFKPRENVLNGERSGSEGLVPAEVGPPKKSWPGDIDNVRALGLTGDAAFKGGFVYFEWLRNLP